MSIFALILLLYLFTLGQSVDQQKWQNDYDQNAQQEAEESMGQSVDGNEDDDHQQSQEEATDDGDDDCSFIVKNSADGSAYHSEEMEEGSESYYQNGQDNMQCEVEYHDGKAKSWYR